MFLMIDNYDSFVYNLKAYFEELGREIMVRRSDQINIEEIEKMQPEGIILSAGVLHRGQRQALLHAAHGLRQGLPGLDRKSTRLNSSH